MAYYKSILLFTISMFLFFGANSQTNPNSVNLLRNSGFEIGNGSATPGCYDYYSSASACSAINCPAIDRFNNDLFDWKTAGLVANCEVTLNTQDCGSPDWTSGACGDFPTVNNLTRYVHCASETEGIRSELFLGGNHYNLIGGKAYILKMKYRPLSDNGCFRIFFTKWGEHWNSNSNNNQKWEAINCNVYWSSSADGFISEIRTFIAPSGSNYDQLGNLVFRLCEDGSGADYTKFLIDDVELYEEDACPYERAIENTIYWQQNKIIQAANTLKAGFDENNPLTDNGYVVVKYNSNIIYRAGNQVVLDPGFSTEYGCYFEAVIEPCEANPCPSAPEIPQFISACFGDPTNIGVTNSETGLLYSWSPAQYLDDPTSPNPQFIPPPGSGSITYMVTVSSICGYVNFFPNYAQTITQEVNVYWNDNPDPTPSVTLSNIQTTDYDFSLDIAVDQQTEYVCFYFNEVGTGDLIAAYCLTNDQYYDGTGFTCCNFAISWDDFPDEIRKLLTACKDYNITVASQNFCYSNAAYQSFLWDRNNNLNINLVTNVMSIPDPPNEYFYADVSGADSYHVIVFTPQGGQAHNVQGIVLDNPINLWDGWCDGFGCFPLNCWADNGTYFYTLELTNSCGTQLNASGNITLFYDDPNSPDIANCVRSMLIINDTIESNENTLLTEDVKNNISVYPNPTNDQIEIKIDDNLLVKNIHIFSSDGQMIYDNRIVNKIDLSVFANGMYFIHIDTDQGMFREKIIKN